ncbi:MAG: hypothetical protein II800_05165 [Lachnospiraceae bacterium]|nr:hypothetical protein [Lachnospiraceae bacterium]
MNTTVYVQLGWLQTAVTWVYEHSLKPLFDLMSNVISTIFDAFFSYVLLPILKGVYGIQIEVFKALFMNILYNLLFRLTRVVMWVLDAVENIFRTFAGLNPVYIQDANGKLHESTSLLVALFQNSNIRGALLGMIMISFVLCFLTSIFATIRAIGDLGGNDGKIRSINRVMRLTGSALLRLILIPLMGLFLVVLGDAVLLSIDNATNAEHAEVSDILFTMSTLDAVRKDVKDGDSEFYNSSTRSAALAGLKASEAQNYADFGLMDKYRKPYYLGRPVEDEWMRPIKEALGTADTKKREFMAEVLETFDIRRMDYFIAIGGTVLFIYLFGTMAVSMIARIFDCLILLLVEPFFAATMPLDEGKKFDKWQEVFIGRLISGYGMIVGVNIYLKVIALVFSGKVAFFGEGTTPSVDYITRIIFILAGAYAITQAGPVVTGIMSAQAGAREKEMMTQGGVITRAAMGVMTAPGRFAASLVWNEGVAAAKEGAVNLFSGKYPLLNGGNPQPGVGDAFGTPGAGKGPGGAPFNGKKIEGPGGTAIQTGTGIGGTGGAGTGGGAFGGKKGEPGTASPVPTVGSAINGTETDLAGTLGTNGTAGTGQQFTESNKPTGFEGPLGGLDAPIGGAKPGVFSFLDQPGEQNEEYTWIGQRDQEEREERKKYEELLGSQFDDIALNAAESETGMDLNGDGFIVGSINDVDDDDDDDTPVIDTSGLLGKDPDPIVPGVDHQ